MVIVETPQRGVSTCLYWCEEMEEMDTVTDVVYQAETAVQANGIEIVYDAFGNPDDPPFLLVMGLGMQMIGWDEEFCAMIAERGYWVVRFDNRDVGRSTKFEAAGAPSKLRMAAAGLLGMSMPAPYLLKDMAADAVGLMDALGIERAHVVGVSMGGMIAQEMAMRYPERMRSLISIMSSTGARNLPQPKPSVSLGLLRSSPSDEETYVRYFTDLITVLSGPVYPPDPARLRMKAQKLYRRGYYPVGRARQLSAILASGDRTQRLAKVTVPTLVVHGSEDPLVLPAGGRATAKAIPNAQIKIIEGMGHTLSPVLWETLTEILTGYAADVTAST